MKEANPYCSTIPSVADYNQLLRSKLLELQQYPHQTTPRQQKAWDIVAVVDPIITGVLNRFNQPEQASVVAVKLHTVLTNSDLHHENPYGYVARTAKNSAADARKSKTRQIAREQRLADFSVSAAMQQALTPEDEVIASDTHRQLLETLLDTVPKSMRIAFLLHVEGYTNEDISQQLDIPINTVKTRIHRGRKYAKSIVELSHNSRQSTLTQDSATVYC